ncbi:MAG: glycerol-3-phosphate dehydrogenase/oxidase [Chloroflexi bacterium]|nr:glycerol-3-phosphate dehydrogenase/oxidase [Chloroflexota bacterium]MCI0577657.1 glycerol-3-phosphate dehydrogenase/oxidase [Chloroflexota bacterium]MCI0644874.1 glycerol-3-phosphate dehydrogenase/oxidase [Chloroflexota bacterium]MCI0725830.1 glycerol-3-phosphate dehydrogenase/oxidase [Chloroflexota bacterium]
MWTVNWRDRAWGQLDRPWDMIVIGGGITGAGVLREATRAGLRTLLVEAGDFASGTSSRSSKVVHGGLRYLRNGQVHTTLASVHERERLLREGKGLVTPLGFVYATFQGDHTPLWLVGLALTIYGLLGRRWGHKRYGAADLRRLCPHLAEAGLKGGYRYFDAQTDDARLVLRLVREGVRSGGLALNYARAEGLLRRNDGQVCGVALRDLAPGGCGRTVEIQAAVVVNATGAYADELRRQVGAPPRLRRLRGSHLVFPAGRLPVVRSINFAHPADGRPVFALPWEGVTLFGTTDVDHDQPGDAEPAMSPAEAEYLLEAARYAFPGLALTPADVQASFAGVRAVVGTGKADPSKESREHVLWQEKGLLTISGGKLTTFRAMAHDALQAIRLPGRPSLQEGRVLDEPGELVAPAGVGPARWLRLLGRYGAETGEVVAAAGPGELAPAGQSMALWAELRWAARAEGVVHLDDLLLRRVRLGLLLPQGGLPWLEEIRAIVQPELGWDDARWEEEAAAYAGRWQSAYSLGI